MSNHNVDGKQLAAIDELATPEEKAALRLWVQFLSALQGRSLTKKELNQEARQFFDQNPDIAVKTKSLLLKAKNVTWTNRTVTQRWMIWSLLAFPATFAGKGVGVASAGIGIGLRLWAVVYWLSSGAIAIIENQFLSKRIETEYTVIDSKKK